MWSLDGDPPISISFDRGPASSESSLGGTRIGSLSIPYMAQSEVTWANWTNLRTQ